MTGRTLGVAAPGFTLPSTSGAPVSLSALRGGLAIRGSFLVDGDGILRWSAVNPRSQARPLAAHREALATL